MAIASLAIVGAGQIGSRHLQSLARLGRPATIAVVDPGLDSLERARQRFEDCEPTAEIGVRYAQGLDALPPALDVAVVATGADVRLDVIERLLARSRVRHLILEKVLFQGVSDLRRAGDAMRAAGVKAWVNCPCRIWPHYVALKQSLEGAKVLGLRMAGVNWGIGCNAIHMLDLVAYLNETTSLEVDASCLDPEPVPSKRAGFLEFTGAISARFTDGCAVNLVSYPRGRVPSLVEIDTESAHYVFDESAGSAFEAGPDGTHRRRRIEVPLQSTLTSLVVRDLLDGDACGLTPFDESARLHEPLLQALLGHLRRLPAYREIDRCPIT